MVAGEYMLVAGEACYLYLFFSIIVSSSACIFECVSYFYKLLPVSVAVSALVGYSSIGSSNDLAGGLGSVS